MGCIMFIGTPRGAFTSILYLFLELPPRVFLGILSEYCTHKYSPELVNKDFGDFLVTGYIVYRHPPVAHAWGITKFFLYIFMDAFRRSLYIPLGIYEGIFGVYPKNTRANFLGKSGSHSKCTKVQRKFVP